MRRPVVMHLDDERPLAGVEFGLVDRGRLFVQRAGLASAGLAGGPSWRRDRSAQENGSEADHVISRIGLLVR